MTRRTEEICFRLSDVLAPRLREERRPRVLPTGWERHTPRGAGPIPIGSGRVRALPLLTTTRTEQPALARRFRSSMRKLSALIFRRRNIRAVLPCADMRCHAA